MVGLELTEALVGAYRSRVEQRLAAAGIEPPPDLAAALDEGERWLRDELERLLAVPFPRQRRAPLELFQEAMRFPTRVLAEAGVPPVPRDPAVVEALPGDHYDLAPASSRDLGEEVWLVHLAWGAEKVQAIVPPMVGLLSADLMDASRIEELARGAGYRVIVWRRRPDPGARPPPVAFVDLTHRDADDTIRSLAELGVRVYGFGPHVDDLAMVRARSLGAADAMPRSRFFARIGDLLPEPV